MKPSDTDKIVESVNYLARSIGDAITAHGAPGHDEAGGTVASLTEAVMGVTAGLCKIASAIEHLAEAVEDSK
jgi:hypothetical protein